MVGTSVGSLAFNTGSADISVSQVGNNVSKVTSYNFIINPSLAWFVSDNTAVGVLLNINPSGNKTTYEQNGTTFQSDKSNTFNIGLGGFVRHYLGSSGSLYPFGQFGINLGVSNLKTEGFFMAVQHLTLISYLMMAVLPVDFLRTLLCRVVLPK